MTTDILEVGPGALSDYYDWLKQAAAGDVLIYWSGDLQYDRQVVVHEADVLRTQDRERIFALNIIAERVLTDAKDGQILLTQKRLGQSVYEYRATRRTQFHLIRPAQAPNDTLVPA
jgi:hypothetical protein